MTTTQTIPSPTPLRPSPWWADMAAEAVQCAGRAFTDRWQESHDRLYEELRRVTGDDLAALVDLEAAVFAHVAALEELEVGAALVVGWLLRDAGKSLEHVTPDTVGAMLKLVDRGHLGATPPSC